MRALAFFRRFIANTAGGMAVTVAVALPVLATVAAGAVDIAAVTASRSKLQEAVDAAALSGAKQLGMADEAGLQARSEQYVAAELGSHAKEFTYKVATSVSNSGSDFTVKATANRTSFFANLLPPGGWDFGVSATAQRLNQQPLCVLVSGTTKNDELLMKDQSDIQAPGCAVHGNGDISVTNLAQLKAALVETSGLASGLISPQPQTGAPQVDDPFASMNLVIPGALCTPLDLIVDLGVQILTPGVHCGKIEVAKNSTLMLLPGEHYFRKGELKLRDNSKIVGSDVVMIFDAQSDFKFQDKVSVELEGRKSGVFSGFVVATTRDNTSTFEISSDAARKLLGTLYIPSATLEVKGGNTQVADQSAWTVIVAKSIKMSGAPNLVINANYAGSSVPVPKGVGPGATNVRLAE